MSGQIIGNDRVIAFPCTPEQEAHNDTILQSQVDYITNVTIPAIVAGTSDHKFSLDITDEGLSQYGFFKDKVTGLGTSGVDDRDVEYQDNGDGTVTFYVDTTGLGGAAASDHKVSLDAADELAVGYDYLEAKLNPIAVKGGSDVDVKFYQSGSKINAFVEQASVITAVGASYSGGCGITISGSTISVDRSALIGPGLTGGTGCALRVDTNTTIRSVTGISLSLSGSTLLVTLTYKDYLVYATDPGTTGSLTGSVPTTTTCP